MERVARGLTFTRGSQRPHKVGPRPAATVVPSRSSPDRRRDRKELAMDRPNRSIMVLAVHTLGGPRLGRTLLDLAAEQPASFHFVVSSTIPEYGWTWTEAQVECDARR